MCGRFTITDPRQLALRFDLAELAELPARFNVAPTQPVPMVVMGGRIAMARWGLVPSWAKDPSVGSRMINARAESLETKPAFRDALGARRCLVLGDGFFEWKKEGPLRRPFYLHLASDAPFAFAGLWDEWRGPDGLLVVSCTIVTTGPNALVAPIHDRMPAILLPDAEARWLDPNVQDLADLVEVLQPYPSHLFEAFEVARTVNSPAHDVPECVLRV
jgi:putative SOS response-associated peptidase YedK